MKKIVYLTLFFLALAPHIGLAKPSIQLRVELDPKEITIGDPILYNITVISSTDIAPMPVGLPKSLNEFELLDYKNSQPKKLSPEKLTYNHLLVLTTFSTGTQTIPAITLNFKMANGEKAEAKTQEFDINVISVLEKFGDEGGLRPLKGFYNFKSYLWIWILLAVLLLIGLGVFLYKRHELKKLSEGSKAVPPRPPEEVIWETIHELEQSELMNPDHAKEFYSRLSGALRFYLQGRFHFSALDRTTAELLNEFKKLKLSLEETQALRAFFESGDLVKFAKLTPKEEEIEEDLERVKKIVHLTTPQKVEKEKEKIPV